MSYHRHSLGDRFVIPKPPTDTEIARNRLASSALDALVRSNAAITRENILYMFETMPIVGCFGGPVPEYPSDVKEAVERMPHGTIVPAAWVRRVYARWNPGNVRY